MIQMFVILTIISGIVAWITYSVTKSSITHELNQRYEVAINSQLEATKTKAYAAARKEAAVDFAGMIPSALVSGDNTSSELSKARQVEILMQEHRELLDSKVKAARQEALNEGREEVRKSLMTLAPSKLCVSNRIRVLRQTTNSSSAARSLGRSGWALPDSVAIQSRPFGVAVIYANNRAEKPPLSRSHAPPLLAKGCFSD